MCNGSNDTDDNYSRGRSKEKVFFDNMSYRETRTSIDDAEWLRGDRDRRNEMLLLLLRQTLCRRWLLLRGCSHSRRFDQVSYIIATGSQTTDAASGELSRHSHPRRVKI